MSHNCQMSSKVIAEQKVMSTQQQHVFRKVVDFAFENDMQNKCNVSLKNNYPIFLQFLQFNNIIILILFISSSK